VQDTYLTYHIAPSHLGGYPVSQASRRHASYFLGTRHESHAEDRTDDMDEASPRSLGIAKMKGTWMSNLCGYTTYLADCRFHQALVEVSMGLPLPKNLLQPVALIKHQLNPGINPAVTEFPATRSRRLHPQHGSIDGIKFAFVTCLW
jgi:hypothetical protein